MKRLIISVIALSFLVAGQVKGAQVYTPAAAGESVNSPPSDAVESVASWSANTLYVRGGTPQPRVELRSDKAVSELDIADIADRRSEFAAVEVVRLESLGDPLIGESLSNIAFNAPANTGPGKQLLAIAWLFAIGLIGMATVGRRKKL